MTHAEDRYYVPHDSHWPFVGSVGPFLLMVGASSWLNGSDAGFWVMMSGVAVVIFMLAGWFSSVSGESISGRFNQKVDMSVRMGRYGYI